MAAQTMTWDGKSGTSYKYWIYPIGHGLKEEAGNYIYAKETNPGLWRAIYIGQTEDLRGRLGNHEKEECALRNGATHIHAHLNVKGEINRLTEEKDLIVRWKPKCNDHHTG